MVKNKTYNFNGPELLARRELLHMLGLGGSSTLQSVELYYLQENCTVNISFFKNIVFFMLDCGFTVSINAWNLGR